MRDAPARARSSQAEAGRQAGETSDRAVASCRTLEVARNQEGRCTGFVSSTVCRITLFLYNVLFIIFSVSNYNY
jgi:hypothetical protein